MVENWQKRYPILRISFFIPTRMCDIIFDIIFVPELHLNLCCCMIKTSSDLFRKSSAIFGNFSRIFGNLPTIVENLKNIRIIYNKKKVAWSLGDTKFLFLLMFQHSQINFVSPRGHVISFTKPPLKHPTSCCLGKMSCGNSQAC